MDDAVPQHRNFCPPPIPLLLLSAVGSGHSPCLTSRGASSNNSGCIHTGQLHQTTSNVFAFDGEYIQHRQVHPTPATTFKTGNYIQQRELHPTTGIHPTALFALFSIPSAARYPSFFCPSSIFFITIITVAKRPANLWHQSFHHKNN